MLSEHVSLNNAAALLLRWFCNSVVRPIFSSASPALSPHNSFCCWTGPLLSLSPLTLAALLCNIRCLPQTLVLGDNGRHWEELEDLVDAGKHGALSLEDTGKHRQLPFGRCIAVMD